MTATIRISVADLTPQFIARFKEKYPDKKLEIKVSPSDKPEHLQEALFWQIISLLDWSKAGDNAKILAPAIQKLTTLPIRFIYQFQDLLAQKLFMLDGRAYAQNIGEAAWQELKLLVNKI